MCFTDTCTSCAGRKNTWPEFPLPYLCQSGVFLMKLVMMYTMVYIRAKLIIDRIKNSRPL